MWIWGTPATPSAYSTTAAADGPGWWPGSGVPNSRACTVQRSRTTNEPAGAPAPAGAPPGSLVVRDRRTVHAPLFGTPLPGHEARPSAATVALYAVGVAGVPQIHIDEALWVAAELLGGR